MSAVLTLINILLALIAVVLIVSVLMQEGTRQGLGAITGGAETFFGKNKAKSYEGKLELITKIAAGAFIVLAIVSTILTSNLNKQAAAASDTTAVEATAAPEDAAATAAPEATEATAAPEVTEAPAATEAPVEGTTTQG